VMPTGAGKSLCYQVPAMLLSGITLVISPLISLMQDQVKDLNEAGVDAAFINSSLSEKEMHDTFKNASKGQYKIIYVAPERLMSEGFVRLAKGVEISMITVDEAHCISQWGQDFRPSYMDIAEFVNVLDKRPIISAFTATATQNVREDIICSLGLTNPYFLVTGFDRENLFFQVDKPKSKDRFILDYLDRHKGESGIIYCATRKNVDSLYTLLKKRNISVAKYHAGMSIEERKQMQDDFVFDYTSIVIATNAFGMGIDKSNVRFVIHYNMPSSMENYYQEAGRAGRDGLNSECILLFSPQDIIINRFLLEHKDFSDIDPTDAMTIRERDIKRLQIMEGYCYTTECLRNYILKYFGEDPKKPCDDCGNCLRQFETLDMTDEAKKIINCIYESRGRYGKNIIMDTVLGAKTARLEEIGASEYKSYGVLESSNKNLLRRLIEELLLEGYIQTGEYQVLKLGDISKLKLKDTKVLVKITDEDKATNRKLKPKKNIKGMDSLTSSGFKLFDKLKELRLEIAREEKMPPYIVFNDKTLIDMCAKMPTTKSDMLNVSGVGENKYGKYGERFIDVIKEYTKQLK
ncbi:MAG: DNA helicase RecQ, partial [Lachnospiraceae bacterium]